MKIIKCIAEKIQEEVKDANAYIDLAMEWKSEQPEAAAIFAQLSTEEIGHADRLHGLVMSLIRKYRSIGTARKPRVNILVLFSMPSSLN